MKTYVNKNYSISESQNRGKKLKLKATKRLKKDKHTLPLSVQCGTRSVWVCFALCRPAVAQRSSGRTVKVALG